MEKIEKAYSSEATGKLGRELAQCLEKYYSDCQSLKEKTIPSLLPGKYVDLALSTLQQPHHDFTILANLALSYGHRLHDP
ncbi:MAG: hypothetical protein ACKOA8_03370, partial [Deltaproteobacteria bacterium]